MNNKTLFSIATLFSCCLSSALFATNEPGQSGTMMQKNNQTCPEMNCPCPPQPCAPCEPNPCCPTTPAYGYDVPCNFAILYDAGPRVCNGTDLFVTIDFIWWTAREDGFTYATTGVNTTDTADGGKGSVKKPDFDWTPGFKVGAGLNTWHDGWDVYVQYTWLHKEGDKTTSASDLTTATNQLFGTWLIGGYNNLSSIDPINTITLPFSTILNTASGRWDLHFNVIDGELGRNYFVSQYLTLRPFVGLKGTWQHQHYKVRYSYDTGSNSTVSPTTIVLNKSRMKQDHDMWGIGIRAGVNLDWQFVRYFSLFSDWALTALMTKSNVDRKDRLEQYDPTTGDRTLSITTYHASYEHYTLKGVLELDLGLRFDIWFGCNDAFHFRLQAAWEEQLWWNQNQMISRYDERSGDMVLHGLTIKTRLDF